MVATNGFLRRLTVHPALKQMPIFGMNGLIRFCLKMSVLLVILVCVAVDPTYAQHNCIELFKGNAQFKENLPGVESIPAKELQQLHESYIQKREKAFGQIDNGDHVLFEGLTIADTHAKNYFRGTAHSRVLEKLGFKFRKDSAGKPQMDYPETVLDIFNNYELRIKDWIRKGIITGDEALRPALILQKMEGEFPADPQEYRVFSPALDKWPGVEWSVATHVPQFSHQLYYKFVASGRVPFATGTFLNHDLSHLSDLYQSPEIMRQYARYGREVMKASMNMKSHIEHSDTGFSMRENSVTLMSEYRSLVYGEWFTVPDISKSAKIKRLIPEYFSSEGPKDLPSALSFIQNLPSDARAIRTKKFIQDARSLILSFGGGMKDVRSYYAFDNKGTGPLVRLNNILRPHLPGAKIKPKFDNDANRFALIDSLPKLIDLLEHLSKFTSASDAEFRNFLNEKPEYEHVRQYLPSLFKLKENDPSGEYRQLAERAIVELLSRLEVAFYKAVELSLTPEIAYLEGRTRKLSETDRYYKYLRSFMHPDSYTAFAFELNRDASSYGEFHGVNTRQVSPP
jgi:hypothetical protein